MCERDYDYSEDVYLDKNGVECELCNKKALIDEQTDFFDVFEEKHYCLSICQSCKEKQFKQMNYIFEQLKPYCDGNKSI